MESVDDCDGQTCENGGTCVDGNGEYYCQCPLDKTGPDCNQGQILISFLEH